LQIRAQIADILQRHACLLSSHSQNRSSFEWFFGRHKFMWFQTMPKGTAFRRGVEVRYADKATSKKQQHIPSLPIDRQPIILPMAYSLSILSGGHCSFDFTESDIPAVAAAIKELFFEPIEIKGIMANELRFGEARFTFYNEWNDPCIISSCQVGNNCLKKLHSHLLSATNSIEAH